MRLLLIGFLLLAQSAYAARDVRLTWEHPTLRVDGTVIDISEIAVTQIRIDGTTLVDVPAPANTYQYTEGFGTHTYEAQTVDVQGIPSGFSLPIAVEVIATPNKPKIRKIEYLHPGGRISTIYLDEDE